MYVDLIISVPLSSSEPIFNKATLASSFGKRALNKADPIKLKSSKFFSLQSMLAPKSKTILVPVLFGHKPDKAGLSIFSIILRFNLAITNKAPVFPAETTMSDCLFLTLSIASHILVCLPLFAALNALSVPLTSSSV